MSNFDVITIGGATKDFFLWSDQCTIIDNKKDVARAKLLAFEYGAKIYTNKFFASLGGGALNVAVGLARLGFRTAPLICLNSQEKVEYEWIKKILKKEKVNTALIQNSPQKSIGASFIIIDEKSGEHTIFSYRGVNEQVNIDPRQKFKTKWIYLTSMSGNKADNKLKKIATIVRDQKIKLVFNPGSAQIAAGSVAMKKLFKITDILIINRDEAIELTLFSHHYNRAPHIKVLLQELYLFGPKLVVITDGANGAYAYNGKKVYFQRANYIKKPVDTTGAGDAFGSGFLAGVLNNMKIEDCLRLGIKNGASVIKKIGAQTGLMKK